MSIHFEHPSMESEPASLPKPVHPQLYRFCIAGVCYEIESPVRLRLSPEDRKFLVNAYGSEDLQSAAYASGSEDLQSAAYTSGSEDESAFSPVWKVRIHLCDSLPDAEQVTFRYSDPTIQIGIDAAGNDIRFYHTVATKDSFIYACSQKRKSGIDIFFLKGHTFYLHPAFCIWNMLYLEETLLDHQGLVLHACYLDYHGEAILFTAPSGTGKTTHAKLWERLTAEADDQKAPALIRNGDKVCIRPIDGTWHACGYPFHGSAKECDNITLPIRAIIVIRQAPFDRILRLSVLEKYRILMEQCTVSHYEKEYAERSLSLIEELIRSGPEMAVLECTPKESAFTALYNYLYRIF